MPFDPTPSPGLLPLDQRIAALPRIAGRVQWQTDLPLVCDIVRMLQPTRDGETIHFRAGTVSAILDVTEQTLLRFAAGKRAGGQPWLELREALKTLPATPAPAAEPEAVVPTVPADTRTPVEVALDEAAALFASIPEAVGRCNWRAHPDLVAQGLAALHRAGNTLLNRALLTERGTPINRLEDALRGNWHDKPWPELRKAMADLGVPRPESQLERSTRLIREQHAAHEAPRPDPVPAFKVTRPEPKPTVGPFKPAALVVRDGVVALVDAPPPAPAAMVAKPGDYARKTETPPTPPTLISSQTTKSAKTDPDSGDLFLTTTVVTVTRIAYGTPEHLALSKARAATCAAKSAA